MVEKKKQGKKGESITRRSTARPAEKSASIKPGGKGSSSEKKMVRSSSKTDNLPGRKKVLFPNAEIYKQLVDTVESTMTVFNADGTILFANRYAAHNLSGDASTEMTGKHISEFVSRAQAKDLMEGCRHVIASGKPRHKEVLITMQGIDRWFLNTLHPLSIDTPGTEMAVLSMSRDITGRKEVENTLREVQDLALLGNWIFNVQEKRLWWSEELYRIFDISPEDRPITMKQFLDRVHPDDRKDLEEQIASGKPYRSDYRIVLPDGAIKHIHEEVNIQRGLKGDPVRFSGTAQDVTELKLTEESLSKELELRTTLLDNMPCIALILKNESREIIACNAIARQFGAEVGKTCHETLAQTELPCPFCLAPELWRTGEACRVEAEYLGKFWEGIWVPLGKDIYVHYIFDITERKQAEEQIRRSEQFIRNILDTVDEGFIVLDRDYRILNANKAFCAQMGKKSDDVIGRHCYEITRDMNRPCFEDDEECAVKRAFDSGKPSASLHKYSANGKVINAEMKAYPIKDASGRVTSAINTIIDITEKNLLEEERLKTQKLESIGTLAGGIAHDFNNLLQGIFGYISMARMTIDEKDKSLSMLEQAEKALQQSVNLTNQLLTFSKGGQPVKKVVDPAPVIENATAFAMSGSRSEYRITLDPDLWCVMADGGQIAQVIQNIVLNAAQAMPTGGEVIVSALNITAGAPELPTSLPSRDYVAIRVRDSGAGIPVRYLDKIFDPYFSTKAKGSGLGLATSYSIIQKHEGTITVVSEPGIGSTFTIYIPAVKAEAIEQTVPIHERLTREARVLLMDDEEIVREVAVELLKALGFSAEFAEHGDEAVMKYRESFERGCPFDVVVLDLTVRGGMGGVETVRKLLEIDPAVKAVVSTGYSDDAAVAQYRDHGFRAFLKKPYNSEELKSTLYALL